MERKSIWPDILAAALPAVLRGLLLGAATALAVAGMLPRDAARCLVGVLQADPVAVVPFVSSSRR